MCSSKMIILSANRLGESTNMNLGVATTRGNRIAFFTHIGFSYSKQTRAAHFRPLSMAIHGQLPPD